MQMTDWIGFLRRPEFHSEIQTEDQDQLALKVSLLATLGSNQVGLLLGLKDCEGTQLTCINLKVSTQTVIGYHKSTPAEPRKTAVL